MSTTPPPTAIDPTTTTVDTVMQPPVLCLAPQLDLHAAAEALLGHSVTSAPVVDDRHRVLGVLTARDCLHGELAALYHRGPLRTVGHAMTRRVPVLRPSDPMVRAITRLGRRPVPLFPVAGRDGRLVGEVRCAHLLRAIRPVRARPPSPPRSLHLSAVGAPAPHLLSSVA